MLYLTLTFYVVFVLGLWRIHSWVIAKMPKIYIYYLIFECPTHIYLYTAACSHNNISWTRLRLAGCLVPFIYGLWKQGCSHICWVSGGCSDICSGICKWSVLCVFRFPHSIFRVLVPPTHTKIHNMM